MRIGVVKHIDQSVIKKMVKDKIEAVIFNNTERDVDYEWLVSKFQLIDVYKEMEEANWFSHELVKEKLAGLKKKFSSLFEYKGYDLTNALIKDIYWANFAEYVLLYHIQKRNTKDNSFVFYNKRSFFKKKLALMHKVFLKKAERCNVLIPQKNSGDLKNSIAFRLNDVESINIYGSLLQLLGKKNIVSFQSAHLKNYEPIHEKMLEVFSDNFKCEPYAQTLIIPDILTSLSFIMGSEDDFKNTFLVCLSELRNKVDVYEGLFRSGIKKVVFNAAENEGEGIVAAAVSRKYKAITYNYMNGAKAKEPNNLNTSFDYWFMPEDRTRQLILSYCGVTEKQVPLTGHILQYEAQGYQNSGTLNFLQEKIKGKGIISLFTARVFINEKMQVLEFLKKYLDSNPEIIVLVRKHPSEVNKENNLHERIINLPDFKGDLSEKSLFDLLLVSDLAISFSSTVSLQATWFNVPSINYELTERSRLAYVDNERIFHVNNLESLEGYLNKFLIDKAAYNNKQEVLNAPENIAAIIRST